MFLNICCCHITFVYVLVKFVLYLWKRNLKVNPVNYGRYLVLHRSWENYGTVLSTFTFMKRYFLSQTHFLILTKGLETFDVSVFSPHLVSCWWLLSLEIWICSLGFVPVPLSVYLDQYHVIWEGFGILKWVSWG